MRRSALYDIIILLIVTASCSLLPCQAKVYMTVSPYPARVYETAPPGVAVLTVHAYDNVTGEPVDTFKLEKRGLSEYFNISDNGLMKTTKTIDRTIGFRFQFFVFAVSTAVNTVEWKHVIIEVSEKNLYPPTFVKDTYNMAVYRFAVPGTLIGSVSASDSDDDPYNSHFTIFAPPRENQNQSVLDYVRVTSSGDVILEREPDVDRKVLPLLIRAVDDGSPQMTGTTSVFIVIDDVSQPDTFCLSTTTTDSTLCWKNPMPGRSHQGYNIDVEGPGVVFHRHVEGAGDEKEFCVHTAQMTLGENYTFRVSLDTNITLSTVGIELTFQKLGQGFSIDCLEKEFAACNFLHPCENGADCVMGPDWGLNYTCNCTNGWQGENCTQADLCVMFPCQNDGVCSFKGHQDYTCDCPESYFGQICQHLNVCAVSEPCQNDGVCRMHSNGTYSCACPDYFRGQDCSQPAPCFPSRCGEGGDCVATSDTTFDCSCYRGYYGERCGEINICELDQPCQHSGTCQSTGNNTFVCACPPDFTGPFCEVFNACLLACKNNASCHMMDDGLYNCTCLPSFYGNECQHSNRCHENPCNNGTCNMDDSMPLCDCHPGFFGPKCEEYDPCLTNPCNSHGTCSQTLPQDREEGDLPYECQCYAAWRGLRCEFPDTCRLDICQNGATCQNTPPNTFSCRCPPGYYESDCSKFNPCDVISGNQELCLNGGLCYNTTDSSFWCDCINGHHGDRCQNLDPCFSSPCLNGATCHNHTDTVYNCTCAPGFSGQRCEEEASCNVHPCSNGGSCVPDLATGGSPRCACAEGFLGYFCQIRDPCFDGGSGGNSCNGGSCESVNRTWVEFFKDVALDEEFLFKCHCDSGYTGKRCEIPPKSACDNVQCLNNGDCQKGVCVCPPGFTGSLCEKAVSVCDSSPCKDGLVCKADGPTTFRCVCHNGWDLPDCKPACRAEQTVSSKKGRFPWPQVFAGETAIVTCPYGGGSDVSSATRKCDSLGLNNAVWGKLDDGDCNELGLLEASRRLNALNDLTSNPASLGSEHLGNYTAILEELYVYTLMDTGVASVMMNVVSNLADVNVSVTVASNQGNQTSERLLLMLDNYTADVNVTKGANVSIASPNFEVAAISVDNTSSSFTFTPTVKVDNSSMKMDVSITIPPEAFAENQTEVTSNRKPTRLQMIGHRKSQLFIPNDSPYSESYLEQQPVLSATVTGREIVNLSSPVLYQIRNLKPESNYTCVFWDPENHTWSTEGVITTVKSGNSTVCESFHLTSFAVLLDPSPDFALDTVHEQVLTYISYIGSAVSLFCLTLTIITYGLFRSLNKDKSGKILLNLCIALLLLNAIFLASGLASSDDDDDGLDDNDDACTTVAVILHYLLLASLAWMLVEAAEMYRALVTVFAKYAQCYMLKRCLIGWGVPIVIVAITLGVDTANYKSDGAFCFISRSNLGAYYGALVVPACLVLLVNTVIFIMVTRVILKPRFQQQTQKESEGITPSQVRGAFTVMFLLGVTWVFGPLAINEAKVVFNYLFCILNSLQGFLIFVFRCVFNPEVRLCWLQLIKTGTLKKRRGPIRSAVYSDSSSKADGKSGVYPNGGSHRGSAFGGSDGTSTMKSSLMHSNGWHPKLNGFSGNGQVLERRGTKFSTVDFYQNSTPPESSSPESGGSRKRQHNPITEDERYGDGGGDFTSEGPIFSSTMDYYETGHDGRGHHSAARPVDYDEGEFHGDGGVMDYYESIRTNRKEEPGHVEGEDQKESESDPDPEHPDPENPDPEQPERERRGSSKSSSGKRSSTLRNEQDELTYL